MIVRQQGGTMTKGIAAGSVGAIAIAAGFVTGAGAAEPIIQARAAIQAVLDSSAAAWNSGDLDRFMACYDKAPTTTYVNATHVVHGYDAIRAMYAERFGGGASPAMGQLALEIVDFRLFGERDAYVIGRFHLHRDAAFGGDAVGPTTLLFKRTPAGWRITADHS
jgi:uncharacterized protein (TIGR02246 family)